MPAVALARAVAGQRPREPAPPPRRRSPPRSWPWGPPGSPWRALRGQLLSGDGPSLARAVEDQLLDLARTGNVFPSGTTGNGIVGDGPALAPVLPALGLAGAVLTPVRLPRLAPTAVCLPVVVAAVVRPGHLTPSLAALLLPTAALLVGGAAEHLWPPGAPAGPGPRRRGRPAEAARCGRPPRGAGHRARPGAVDDLAARATGPGPVRAADAGAGAGVAAGVATLAGAAVATSWVGAGPRGPSPRLS